MNRIRSAFTLLEIIAVLAILALIASLGWPALSRMHTQSRLEASVGELRAELYRTRLESMKQGVPYIFRYRPGSGLYEIVPKEIFDRREETVSVGAASLSTDISAPSGENDSISAAMFDSQDIPMTSPTIDGNAPESTQSTSLLEMDTASGTIYRKTLPDTIVFAFIAGQTLLAADGWSMPILFYPNGRTSSTKVTLRTTGAYEFQQSLELRGLTGTASTHSIP